MCNALPKEFIQACYKLDIVTVQKFLEQGLAVSQSAQMESANLFLKILDIETDESFKIASLFIQFGLIYPENYLYEIPYTLEWEIEAFNEIDTLSDDEFIKYTQFFIDNKADINHLSIRRQSIYDKAFYLTPLDIAMDSHYPNPKTKIRLRENGGVQIKDLSHEECILHMKLEDVYSEYGFTAVYEWIKFHEKNKTMSTISIYRMLILIVDNYMGHQGINTLTIPEEIVKHIQKLAPQTLSMLISRSFKLNESHLLKKTTPILQETIRNLLDFLDSIHIAYNQPHYTYTVLDEVLNLKIEPAISLLRQRGAKTFDELMHEGLLHKNPCDLTADSMPYIYVPPGKTLEEALTNICG